MLSPIVGDETILFGTFVEEVDEEEEEEEVVVEGTLDLFDFDFFALEQ